MGYNGSFTPFDSTGFTGTITKMWTDQGSLSVLTTKGEIWSAGYNTKGQFGSGTTGSYVPTPVKFNMPVTATDLYEALGGDRSLYQNLYAVGSNGKVYGAGANTFGQIGNGTTSSAVTTPVAMSVIDGSSIVATQVLTGYGTTVVFTTNGSVYTVGHNDWGQLGDGTTTNRSTPIKAQYINNLTPATY
jgi:alpha-tubulin suppressor-like RCC1 family protein